MERIIINNFGPIKKIDLSLNQMNLFIGESASGKSIVIKLIYYFRDIFNVFYNSALSEDSESKLNSELVKKFEQYFIRESWDNSDFEIIYFYNDNDSMSIDNFENNSNLSIKYTNKISDQYKNILKLVYEDNALGVSDSAIAYRRATNYSYYDAYMNIVKSEVSESCGDKQIFIPAGRSFFATLQDSIFSILTHNRVLDPFLLEFGSYYELIKKKISKGGSNNPLVNNLVNDILHGNYERSNNKDYIIHEDKRRIDLSYASSGQQETLPLILILRSLIELDNRHGVSIYIEEPEAHLFPSAQKKIVELIVAIFKLCHGKTQLFLTTHSPYILSSFNNSLEGGIVEKSNPDLEKLYSVINKLFIIESETLSAYSIEDGMISNIIDEEYGLINSEYLDMISSFISVEFNNLLSLENEL